MNKKFLDKVDAQLLASSKEKYIQRMKAAEECSSDTVDSDCDSGHQVTPNIKTLPNVEETNNAYLELASHCNEQRQLEHESCPSLLLPAFVPQVKGIFVQLKQNSEVQEVEAKKCIDDLMKKRDEALLSAKTFRNQVDQLRSTNRKLYSEMHNRVDTIQNFYRNDIVEGTLRAAICLKLALK